MNGMADWILTAGILAAAGLIVIRKINRIRKKGSGCGCDCRMCGTDCASGRK